MSAARLPRCLSAATGPTIDHLRYPDGTATQAVRIVATQGSSGGYAGAATAGVNTAAAEGADAAAPAGDEDPEAAMRGALAWIGLHARAAAVAEELLAVEIAKNEAKVLLLLFVISLLVLLVFVFHVKSFSWSGCCLFASSPYISIRRDKTRPLVR